MRWRGPIRQPARPGRGYEQGQPAAWREQHGEEPADGMRGSPAPGKRDKTGADRQSERLYAPLVPPGRCTPYVRNHCYASTRSDTR
jgi:hypothetical protein